MEKKYQIFISSTYTDLVEERKKVRDTILSMLHFPVGMEIFGAADEEQWEIIKDTIDSSDYYVLLVAHRYGSIIESGPDAGISYTEKEYRYAKEKEIPILAFLIDDSVPVLPEKMEKDHPEELMAFKQEVKTGRLVEWWKNADDLAQKLSISLHKQMDRKKRPGWVRADSFDIEQSHAELLALNKQVRELEDENKKLRDELEAYHQLKIDRVPKLTVMMKVDIYDDECEIKCHPEYAIRDKNAFLQGLKIYDVSVDDVDNRYRKILKDDFPSELYGFERQSEIDNYNNSLPNKEELEKYKEKLKIYLQCKEAGVCINIGIYNYGTAKASNVSAEMEFPEGVIVYDEGMFDSEGPVAPKVEKNPIELARERKREHSIFFKTSSLVDATSMYAYNPSGTIMDMLKESHSDYEINGHILDINCGTIIHTRNYRTNGIYIAGKTPGKYQIKCTLMCEEYIEPQVEYIDFVVE